MISVGFGREIITPPRGLSLVGYFNPRPNGGVLDDLYVKSVLFQSGKCIGGVVSFDLAFLTRGLVAAIRKRLGKLGITFGDNLIFCATHTHTGPHTNDFFGVRADKKYVRRLIENAALATVQAKDNLYPSTLYCGSVRENPFAFNRRYFMNNGRVQTNPGKRNPDIVKPEGTVDREIGVLAVQQDKRTVGIMANIVNHTDTIGGNLVSGDWPGQMERTIQRTFGYEVPVITLIGASGNINHFDVGTRRNQTCYQEAKRIGRGYAKIVLEKVGRLKKVRAERLRIDSRAVSIPYRVISREEVQHTRKVLKEKPPAAGRDLTSEDIIKGDQAVAYFFAEQLVRFERELSGKSRAFQLVSIKFGKDLAIASLPGEPFTEIGLSIKRRSPFSKTFVVTLAQGTCGYVPLKECFKRGGYEVLPVESGGASEDTAELLIENCLQILS